MEPSKGGIYKEEILGRTSCIVSIVVTVERHYMESSVKSAVFRGENCTEKEKLSRKHQRFNIFPRYFNYNSTEGEADLPIRELGPHHLGGVETLPISSL